MTDLHTHILPGMDDGAKDAAAAAAMLRMEAEQGVAGVALTPHFYRADETPERFLARRGAAWERLRDSLEGETGLPALVLGAEVAWTPNLDRWDELEALCLGGSRYMLLELPFAPWSGSLIDQLYNLLGKGCVTPVLAHLERYARVQKREHLRELLRMGLPIQVSAGCLLRPGSAWRALRLIKSGRSVLVASDCHGTERRPPDLGPASRVLRSRAADAGERALSLSYSCSAAAFWSIRSLSTQKKVNSPVARSFPPSPVMSTAVSTVDLPR